MVNVALLLGRAFIAMLEFFGGFWHLLASATSRIVRGEVNYHRTVVEMAEVGTDSVPIVVLTMLFGGAVFGLLFAGEFVKVGGHTLVGGAIGVLITRQIGPVFAGIVVAARVGSAFAAEIGSMKVTEQIDAMRALATNPISYLVVPRLIATALMLPILTAIGDGIGALGGYMVSVSVGVTPSDYLTSTKQFVAASDIIGGLVEALVFGIIIAIVACRQGLAVEGGASGVGRATMRAVVQSIVLIFVANLFLYWFMFRLLGV